MKRFIFLFLSLFLCGCVPTATPSSEQKYPVEFIRPPFYFENITKINNKLDKRIGKLGEYTVSTFFFTNIKNEEMEKRINRKIDSYVTLWLEKGIPKYPGILQELDGSKLQPDKLEVSLQSVINNIAMIEIRRILKIREQFYMSDQRVHYLNLLTGEELSLNDIMNSEQGIEDLGELMLQHIDFLDNPSEREFFDEYLHPLGRSFQGLPESTSVYVYRDHLTILLDENCESRYMHEHRGYWPYHVYIYNFASSLYDRNYIDKIEDNATEGIRRFNFPDTLFGYPRKPKQSNFAKDIALTEYVSELSPFYEQVVSELKQQALIELMAWQKELEIDFSKTKNSILITENRNTLVNRFEARYEIRLDNIYISGQLEKNYSVQGEHPVQLKDLFRKNFDYQTWIMEFMKQNYASLLSNQEVVFEDLVKSGFGISEYGISFHPIRITNAYQKQATSAYIYIPWENIGLENVSPFLKGGKLYE